MKKLLLSFILFAIFSSAQAQKPLFLTLEGDSGMFEDSLQNGFLMEDLSWAWNSSNACFVSFQQKKFSGNHKLYVVDLPAYTEMEVTLVPNDKNANMSLYAYQVGQIAENTIVPNLPSSIRCEADFKWDRPRVGKTQNHTRTVSNLVAIRNPYKLVIGVAGADGLKAGSYKLQIKKVGK